MFGASEPLTSVIFSRIFLIILFERQSARQFFYNEKIIVNAKENKCHDRKNNNFVQSIRSLNQNKYHHYQ